MEKVIVFDLDGTLLDSKKNITERSIKNIKMLHNNGIKIIFATARPPRFVEYISSEFDFKFDQIFYNGAMTIKENGVKIIHTIESRFLKQIVEVIEKSDAEAVISIECNDSWLCFKDFEYEEFYKVNKGPERISKHKFVNQNCTKILVNRSSNDIELKRQFSEKYNIMTTDNNSLIQITSKMASKERAVEKLLKDYGYGFSDVLSFGDDYNDIGLFEKSNRKIAMGNAVLELKEKASYVTKTNDQDGVSEFIENEFIKQFEISS